MIFLMIGDVPRCIIYCVVLVPGRSIRFPRVFSLRKNLYCSNQSLRSTWRIRRIAYASIHFARLVWRKSKRLGGNRQLKICSILCRSDNFARGRCDEDVEQSLSQSSKAACRQWREDFATVVRSAESPQE